MCAHRFRFSELPDSCFKSPATKFSYPDGCGLVLFDADDFNNGLLDLKISSLVSPESCFAEIVIGKIRRKASLRINIGKGSRVSIGSGVVGHWHISSWHNSNVVISDDTTANNTVNIAVKVLVEPGATVLVGKDCMFSDGITLQCGGQHSIISLDSREILSLGDSRLIIEDHCWIGRDSTIVSSSKETSIGSGGVVATRAVLTKSIPPCCIVAGNPARVVRDRVTWSRQFRATKFEVDRLFDQMDAF